MELLARAMKAEEIDEEKLENQKTNDTLEITVI